MNAAREKVEREGECRVCGYGPADRLDAAHIWDRSLGGGGFDNPDLIVPLCSRIKGGVGCHDDYDSHRLNLLPYLRPEELDAAARVAGTRARALRRITGAGLPKAAREEEPWAG